MEWNLLKDIPEDQVRELLANSRRRRFARREVLFHAGDPAGSLHLMAKGRVAIRVTTPLGDVATLDLVAPGGVFGEMALLAPGAVRSATAVALEATETRSIDADAFAELRRRQPELTEVLVVLLAARVRQLNDRLLEALYLPADIRLLRRLVQLTAIYGAEVPLTQEDLAGLAGATRATVNRVLRREEKEGTVVLGRGRLTILDQQALAKRAR